MLSSQIMPHFIAKDEATGAPCSEVDVDMRDLREMWDIGPCIGPRLVIISRFHKLLTTRLIKSPWPNPVTTRVIVQSRVQL